MADVPPAVRREDEDEAKEELQERLLSRSPSQVRHGDKDKDEDDTDDEDDTKDEIKHEDETETETESEQEQPLLSQSPPPPRLRHQAMDLFPDGHFVRLRSCGNGKYVHADDDGAGVSLRRRANALNAVWRVQHWVVNEERTFVLLQGAAYGRYLAVSDHEQLPGHPGRRAVQRDLERRNFPEYLEFRWMVDRLDADADYVRLVQYDLNLRANGRYFSWKTGVTADSLDEDDDSITTMMQWTVQEVPAGPEPPVLPVAWLAMGGRCSGLLFWRRDEQMHHGVPGCKLFFWRLTGTRVRLLPRRRIKYLRADDDGNIDDDQNPISFPFNDNSVVNLRAHVAQLQDDGNEDVSAFTLCVRPGLDGRLMPLVTDLPRSGDVMLIVSLRTGSPAAQALVYPQI